MAAALVIILIGATLAYSAFTNTPIIDLFAGLRGTGKSPTGPNPGGLASEPGLPAPGVGSVPAQGNDPKGEFKGPNAGLLRFITDAAQQNFNLKVSQVCRPRNATYGAKNSRHKDCRAVDLTGSTADKIAFARWVRPLVTQVGGNVFIDQIGWVAPGFDHSDHVHVDA